MNGLKKIGKRVISVFLSFVMVFSLCVTAIAFADSEDYTVSYDVTYRQTEARKAIDEVNSFRTGDDAWYYNSDGSREQVMGLKSLTYDYDLEQIAMQRAAELAVYFNENRADYSSFETAFSDAGYEIVGAAQSIYGAGGYYGSSASQVVSSFKDDDGDYSTQTDRRTMLNGNYTNFGVGCVYLDETYYWVFLYSEPVTSHSTSATTANDSVTTVSAPINDSFLYMSSSSLNDIALRDDDTYTLPALSLYVTPSYSAGSFNDIPVTLSGADVWSSSDTSVAMIESGKVKGVGTGIAKITATVNGMTTSFTVSVIKSSDVLHVEAVPSTCITHGNIEYWYIEILDQYYADEALTKEITEEDTILPLGDHQFVEIERVEPTCDTDGYILYRCEVCGYEKTEDIPSLYGHTWTAEFNWDIEEEPYSCTVTFTCEKCGAVEGPFECGLSMTGTSDVYVHFTASYEFAGEIYTDTISVEYGDDVLVFDWNENHTECFLIINGDTEAKVECEVGWVTTIEPTCTTEGFKEYVAWYGDYMSDPVWTEDIPALGHNWVATFDWNNDYTECSVFITCTRCNEVQDLECVITETDDSYIATATYGDETFTDVIEKEKESVKSNPVDVLKEELQALLDSYATLDSSDYTEESWSLLEEAIKNAETVLADENATEEEVQSAIQGLMDAYDALVETDKGTTQGQDGDTSGDNNGDSQDGSNTGAGSDSGSSDSGSGVTTTIVNDGTTSGSSDNVGSSTGTNVVSSNGTDTTTTEGAKTGDNMLFITIGLFCLAGCGLAVTLLRKPKAVLK